MKKIIPVLFLAMVFTASCKKTLENALIPQGNLDNEIQADVSLSWSSSPPEHLKLNGSSVAFTRGAFPNDSLIHISGGGVQITLDKVYAPGTYYFNNSSTQFINCNYEYGCFYSCPYDEYYFPVSGIAGGSITIETLAPAYIKGTFNANCTGPHGTVLISSGSFKGSFY